MTADIDTILESIDPTALQDVSFLRAFNAQIEHLLDMKQQQEREQQLKDEGQVLPVGYDFLFAVYDQRHLLTSRKVKWYSPNTSLGDRTGSSRRTLKKGICVHHTAVTGGFGVGSRTINDLLDGDLSAPDAKWLHAPEHPLTPAEQARAHGLALRYRAVPYHAISAPNSVLYLNLPFEMVTWHGDGANNDYLGFAWDGNSLTDKIPSIAADVKADLIRTYEIAREEGHPIAELTTHSTRTRKPSDPGAEFIELVVEPAAKECKLTIAWDYVAKVPGARSMAQTVGRAP